MPNSISGCNLVTVGMLLWKRFQSHLVVANETNAQKSIYKVVPMLLLVSTWFVLCTTPISVYYMGKLEESKKTQLVTSAQNIFFSTSFFFDQISQDLLVFCLQKITTKLKQHLGNYKWACLAFLDVPEFTVWRWSPLVFSLLTFNCSFAVNCS